MLCPKECVLAGASGTYSVCVCIAHNNIKLMMHGSSIAKIVAEYGIHFIHFSNVLAKIMCNPPLPKWYFNKCESCPGTAQLKEILIKYYSDMSIDEIHLNSGFRQSSSLELLITPKEDFIDMFLEKLDHLKQHDFIAKQQSSSMQLYCSTILKNKDTVYV